MVIAEYRNLCLFTMGINMAWRANELLSIKVGQVRYLEVGDLLELKQSKNGKYRSVPVNQSVLREIRQWLVWYDIRHGFASDDMPLFRSAKGGRLGVPSLCNLVKSWCLNAELRGRFGSHSLRKTFGYQQRVRYGAHLSLLVCAFGHSSEMETLRYLGIQEGEISALYDREV